MYTKIHDRIWAMFKRNGISPEGQRLYIYLFSCPHRTLLGIYKLPISYIAEDLEISVRAATKLIAELVSKRIIEYDAANSCVLLKKFLECNEIPNKNVEKKAVKIAASVLPATDLIADFLSELAPYKEKLPYLFETVLKRYCEQFGKPFDEQYLEWYGNTESRKQKTEDRRQKAEAEDRRESPAGAGSAAADGDVFLDVLEYYRTRYSAPLPAACETLLREYVAELSDQVVKKAIDKAVTQGGTTWAYVNTILGDWRANGINTLTAVLAEEDRFRMSKRGLCQPASQSQTTEDVNKNIAWMQEFLEKEKQAGE